MDKSNKSKLFMLISITILVVVLVVSGATYAWYTWSSSEEEETKIVTSLGIATVYYNDGKNIEGVKINPVETKEEGIVKKVSINTDKEMASRLSFNLYLDILELDEDLKEESFKYALYKDDTIVKEGNFSSGSLETELVECTTNSTNHIVLLSDETITTTVSNYTLYIWIDAEIPSPLTMLNKNFSFKLHADGQNAVLGKPPTAAEYITNLYTSANKTTVTNNSITYNYATSVSLMNDRLGGKTAGLDAGNIRYYGASPDNYIYFNCSDYDNQSYATCEKWRIIGVFDGKVKIIGNKSIGLLAWDQDKNINSSLTTYDNDWSTASLQVLLNQKYYNGDTAGTVTYYSGSSGDTSTSLDMSSIGLKNDTTRNMIAEVTWNLGGWESPSVYSNQIYSYERGTTVYSGRPTSWTGKIALVYPSDYGYAADFNSCTGSLYGYDSSICTSVNWMKTMFGSSYTWLLTPGSLYSNQLECIYPPGAVYNGGTYNLAYHAHRVWPVLYLDSELEIGSGAGTSSNPYRLSVS